MSASGAPSVGVQPGEILAGKYRVESILGQGGMGVVVAAHHLQLDERVALKFLLPEALGNPEAVARFIREARAAVKIKNEHVARVSDVGQLESGSPYMVMEYLDGTDLSGWLTARGALPIDQAVDFVLQASEAIADAHVLGIVHRDLKPANLFCIQRSDGQLAIKVLDFGISKVTTPGAQGHAMTRTTALMGSPLYMSPEQMIQSKGVDPRTDIWSLGVILYELIAGRAPFQAEAVTELAVLITHGPLPRIRQFRPDVPLAFEQVLDRCLAKDRDQRYQTVGELALALKEFAPASAYLSVDRVLGTLRKAGLTGTDPRLAGELRPSLPMAPPSPGALPQTSASWGQTGPTSRPRGVGLAIAGIAMVVLVGLGGGAFLLKKATPPTSPGVAASLPIPPLATPTPTPAAAPEVPAVGLAAEAPTAAPAVPEAAAPPAPQAIPAATPASPRPRQAPAAKPNCDPPYTINAKGSRVFKPECM